MFDRRNVLAALLALVTVVAVSWHMPVHAAATLDRAACSTPDRAGGDPAVCSGPELVESATQEIAKLYQGNALVVQSVGGTANAITGSTVPAATALADGEMRQIKPGSTNTGSVTYNDNGLGAKQVVSAAGGFLGAGDLQSSTVYIMRYYAANDEWRVLTQLGTGTASASNAYVTIGNTGSLSDERALTAGTALTLTDGGAGSTATIALTDAELTCLAALTSAADKLAYYTGAGTCGLTDLSAFARTIIDDADAATMRTTLGVVIGTNVQAFDADLSALAGNSTAGFWAYTGAGTGAARTLTAPAAGFTIANPSGTAGNPTFALANDLASLEGASGTNALYYRSAADTWSAVTIGGMMSFSGGTLNVGDAELSALAGLTSAADALPYFTGSGTAAVTTVSAYARSLIDDADAATMRTTLGLAIGTNVQAYDADLTTWAGVTPSADGQSLVAAANYAAMRGLLDLEAGTDFYSIAAADSAFLSASEIDTSSELAGVLSDETGTGAAVFGTAPTFTTSVGLAGDTVSDFTGIGLALSSGALGLDVSAATDEFCLTYESTGNTIAWQSCGGGGGGGSPGGTNGQIQFNNAGAFDGFTMSGDVSVNTSTGAATVANDAVTYAKMQNVTANSVVARAAATDGDASAVALSASQLLGRGSTGDVAAITLGTGISMSGTTLSSGPAFFANFSSLEVSGTYSRTGTTVTVTYAGHDLEAGSKVLLDYTTGTATDGTYNVTIVDANTFTVTDPSSGSTSGNVTLKLRIWRSTNIASITDNGTGNFTLNFATALSSKRYAMSFMGVPYSSTNMSGNSNIGLHPTSAGSYIPLTKSTTEVRIIVGNPASGAVGDAGDISVIGFL